jgi:hypothetical protein
MVDLSNLKLVEEVIDVADDSQYADAQEFPPPIPEGIYTFVQGPAKFEATAGGFLSAAMDHTVAGGPEDGHKIMFDRVSNKPFDRQGVKVSMMKDHLRALGDRNTYRTHTEYATAVAAGEGKPFQAQVGWEGYCGHKGTPQEVTDSKQGFTVKGAKNFPNGADITCPVCKQGVRPRARITRRIAGA